MATKIALYKGVMIEWVLSHSPIFVGSYFMKKEVHEPIWNVELELYEV